MFAVRRCKGSLHQEDIGLNEPDYQSGTVKTDYRGVQEVPEGQHQFDINNIGVTRCFSPREI
jgi:hypothetical protein